ncbi:MAG TPA: hypothetical protein EYP04_05545 [Anaerolineae bacterium]|nr:hypothetical protein [Anaerolineae bacterium]HIQ05076.1 hypothetical protein [Anaerolineae bacterium]
MPAETLVSSIAPTLLDVYPDKATYRPGEPACIVAELRNNGPADFNGSIHLQLVQLDQALTQKEAAVHLSTGEQAVITVPLTLPAEDFRGYGVELRLLDAQGQEIASASTALDVLSDWTLAPRYGFLADFAPGEPDSEARVAQLSKYHVNVVQFYDWMYRHYQLLPLEGQEEFVDALGRHLSLQTVQAKIAAAHAHNMAALAYGAVYGAEPEYFVQHRDEALYQASGEPYSVDKLFYIMNIQPNSPWSGHIVSEYVRTVTELSFDGIHMDQYGFPKMAHVGSGDGPVVALDDLFGPLINASAAAVRAANPSARVIFNNVNNWPTDKTAMADQAAIYIEVWTPYDTYRDLQRLIQKAWKLGRGEKQVILAAYITPLCQARDNPSLLPMAEEAARLANAAILANGGFHLLLGEQNGALCDPYYPKYATLRPEFARIMRAYADFSVRYLNSLFNPALTDHSGRDQQEAATLYTLEGIDSNPKAYRGTVWTIRRQAPGLITLSLINLRGQQNNYWNLPHVPPEPLSDIPVVLYTDKPVRAVFVASPDFEAGRARQLPFTHMDSGTGIRFTVPRLDRWTLVIVKTGC